MVLQCTARREREREGGRERERERERAHHKNGKNTALSVFKVRIYDDLMVFNPIRSYFETL